MCVTSAVSDYYYNNPRWPDRSSPVHSMEPDTARMLREVMTKLDQIDQRLKDVECKDPTKAAFLALLDERIQAGAK